MNDATERDWPKLLLSLIIGLLLLVLVGQFFAQLFTVRQLHKVSGKTTGKGVKLTGYSYVGSLKAGKRQYSLILRLDGRKAYTVDLDEHNRNLDQQVFIGNQVTLYYPTTIYNILSLDGLDNGSRVSQVEGEDHEVLSSFTDHQHKARTFIAYLLAALLYVSYAYYKHTS